MLAAAHQPLFVCFYNRLLTIIHGWRHSVLRWCYRTVTTWLIIVRLFCVFTLKSGSVLANIRGNASRLIRVHHRRCYAGYGLQPVPPQCRMVLLLNLDTLGTIRDVQLIESARLAISEILRDAWLTVTCIERSGVTNITPIIINRTGRGDFTTPFNQLTSRVNAMITPVTMARTSVTR